MALLSASLDVVPEAGQDIVFCATLALAWSAFRSRFGAGALADKAPPMARSLDALDKGPPPIDEVVPPEASFIATGGPGDLEKARIAVRERFADAPGDLLPASLPAGGRFAFALLDRALAFDPVLSKQDVMFAGTLVRGFGAQGRDPERAKSVVVHDYVPSASFVVELKPKADKRDRIILLATVPPAPWGPPPPAAPPRLSLADRVREALSRLDRLRGSEGSLTGDERFSMPTLRIGETARFTELTCAPIPLADGTSLPIDEAIQNVRFALDETGAQVQSQAVMLSFGAPPRSLTVSGPFLIMLLREGASVPYFAAWIESPDAMGKAPAQPPPPGGFGPFGPPP